MSTDDATGTFEVYAIVGDDRIGSKTRSHGPLAAGFVPAVSPSSGKTFANVLNGDAATADAAVRAAAAAFPEWAATPPARRADVLRRIAAAVVEQRERLAHVLSMDQGKPLLAEAYDEVDELAAYFSMAAEDAPRLDGTLPASVSAERRVAVHRVPLGVVGVVTPWNWPYTMGAELLAPAMAAGNTVVWVPAPTTSACSGVLAELVVRSAVPPGVFNFVPGPGPVVGDAVVGHPQVSGVGFIGSVETGSSVAARAAGKAQILELGGNGPMVVLADADLDLAAEAALEAAYLCAGQSCTAGERFLVEEPVVGAFVERVVELTRSRVRVGDPFDEATTMGPLNNEPTAEKFARHVAGALAQGARLCLGGKRMSGLPTDLYVEPTVLDRVTPDMAIAREETFGPVVPVIAVRSAHHALELANASPYGLTAAVFTGDLEHGLEFAERVRAGWVNVNASTNLWESHLPFGGRAGSVSGRGRVGGRCVLEAFSETKTVVFPRPDGLLR